MSTVPYVSYTHLSPSTFSDKELGDDEEVVLLSKRPGARQEQPMRITEKKQKIKPTWVKLIEGLSAGIMDNINRECEPNATDNHHASTLSISATHYVLLVSVGVSYKNMDPLHVVMDTLAG